jgi:predicted membrane channel-forming protein YqfA (hemolysin III family)
MFHLSPSQSLCNLTKSGFIYLLGYLFYLLKHELERNCAKMQREGDWAWV